MKPSFAHSSVFRAPFAGLLCALGFVHCPLALALDEIFELYSAPQALAIGNAFTADASGYAALFHNPAGLAKATKNGWEITPIALEGVAGIGTISSAIANRGVGITQITPGLTAGSYQYVRGNVVPSFTRRGFGIALLGSYEYAALSDGSTVDIRAGNDFGFVMGAATNLASNMIKIGITGKGILRNQIKGSYAQASLGDATTVSSNMKEGIGIGADVGLMFTLPMSYLPTLGFVWKDIANTRFIQTRLLNPLSTGIPDPIAQSFNLALSAHPAVGKAKRLSISAELRHLELTSVPLTKRIHIGLQFIARKSLFFWAGMNGLFLPTGGVALRMRGGDLEMGTYAQDTGAGTIVSADRRFFIRYTIGF
jgi:hypothetical protein